MSIREQYEQEMGQPAIQRMPRYAGDRFGPEEFTEEYVEWLERKVQPSQRPVECRASWQIRKHSGGYTVTCRTCEVRLLSGETPTCQLPTPQSA